MKQFIVIAVFILGMVVVAEAGRKTWGYEDTGTGSNTQSERVSGYERKDGTYVEPYNRTKADNTLDNNYGTRGNDNPWTGKTGSGDTDSDKQQKQYNIYGTK